MPSRPWASGFAHASDGWRRSDSRHPRERTNGAPYHSHYLPRSGGYLSRAAGGRLGISSERYAGRGTHRVHPRGQHRQHLDPGCSWGKLGEAPNRSRANRPRNGYSSNFGAGQEQQGDRSCLQHQRSYGQSTRDPYSRKTKSDWTHGSNQCCRETRLGEYGFLHGRLTAYHCDKSSVSDGGFSRWGNGGSGGLSPTFVMRQLLKSTIS